MERLVWCIVVENGMPSLSARMQTRSNKGFSAGRRVLWAFKGDECRKGYWYAAGQEICFVYEQDPDGPQCWTFHRIDDGIRARFVGDPNGADLSEVAQSSSPLICAGPDVGV